MAFTTPIAVIGMSCRFPGGAEDPEKLWDLVAEGRTTWTDVPSDRWRWKSFHHPHPEARGAHNARGGCFLESDISEFDAGFFNIPPVEASSMDPQHRVQLELAYEALENAGIPAESIRGSETAVYTAVASRDYDRMGYKDPSDIAKYHLTGCGDPTLCGRISYVFDLKGPSVTLDTGCSGSLVCLHQACTSLRTGESNMAIVGGTHLLLGPDLTIAMSLLHMINDDGRCYAFDSRGSGYGRAEGVASIVLKRLDDAIAAGDPIRAVIRNTGINSDGKTNGILLPSSSAQQRLMKSLYSSAGVEPTDVSYVEAHGTGTMAGDAAETNSISNIYCKDGKRKHTLFVGSIKPNIGHLEATSGLAGLIKTVLMLEKGLVPPVPNIIEMKDSLSLTPHIKIPRALEPWPSTGVRLAAINSFGFGGTNAHAIIQAGHESSRLNAIEEVKSTNNGTTNGHANGVNGSSHRVDSQTTGTNGANSHSNGVTKHVNITTTETPRLFAVTARSEKSLSATLENLHRWIGDRKDSDEQFSDLAYTHSARRSIMPWRWSSVASSYQELASLCLKSSLRPTRASPINYMVFLFTGQGAQWFGMGRELMSTQSAFSTSLNKSEHILKKLGAPWSILEELQKDEKSSQINRSELSQPATTAIQIALVDLLKSFSILPEAVVGHSSGEVAAAYAAGILTHETAMKVSYCRSFISTWCKEDVPGRGSMIAVGLGEEDSLSYIRRISNGTVVVACCNSPVSTTVSGDESAIDELKTMLDKDSVFNRKLQVDTAYHSHHMKIVAGRYLQSMEGVESQPIRTVAESLKLSLPRPVRFFSSVTGAEKASGFDATYWVQNLVSKVQYTQALGQLALQAVAKSKNPHPHLLLEIGPHAALSGPTRQILTQSHLENLKYTYISALIRGVDARKTILDLTGKIFTQGYPANVTAANSIDGSYKHSVVTDLPPYAWDHSTSFWNESRISKEYRMRNHAPHELLGLRIPGTSHLEPTWRNILAVDSVPWLREHIIDNFALFPGSAYLCMAIEALAQMIVDRGTSGNVNKFVMRDIVYSKALVVPESPGTIEIQLTLRPSKGLNDTAWEDFKVTSISDDGVWNEHCRGAIMAEMDSNTNEIDGSREDIINLISERDRIHTMKGSCPQFVDTESFYNGLRENGVDYGTNFSILKDMTVGHCKALGTAVVPDISECMPSRHEQSYLIHPATVDAMMHIVLPLYSRHCSKGPVMLISVDEVTISTNIINKPGDELLVSCDLLPAGSRSGMVEWSAFQKNEQSELVPVVYMRRGEFRGIGEGQSSDSGSVSESSLGLRLTWEPDVEYAQKAIPTSATKSKAKAGHETDLVTQSYGRMANYVKGLTFKKPHLKILELNAGAGDATAYLFKSLAQGAAHGQLEALISNYDFTDISTSHFDTVKAHLHEWTSLVAYKTLDILQDPVAQGFTEANYDLIIAANDLNATSFNQMTLAHARKLLRSGGRLLVLDTTWSSFAHDSEPGDSQDKIHHNLLADSLAGIETAADNFKVIEHSKDMIVARTNSKLETEQHLSAVFVINDVSDPNRLLLAELTSILSKKDVAVTVKSWDADFGSESDNENTFHVILDDPLKPTLIDASSQKAESIMRLTTTSKAILWASLSSKSLDALDTGSGVITSFARVARHRNANLKFVTMDIQQNMDHDLAQIADVISNVAYQAFCSPDQGFTQEWDYTYRDGNLMIPRLLPDTRLDTWTAPNLLKGKVIKDLFHQSDRPVKLHVETPGLLSSLVFVDDVAKSLGVFEVEIQTFAHGVNQKDVHIALGRGQLLSRMTGECAGIVTAVGAEAQTSFKIGDRVCGWGGTAYASFSRLDANMVRQIPDSISYTEAASIPIAFSTAYQALIEVARLRGNQTVLIHSASGGVGQAAIAIAQHVGAQVFATVGSVSKRELLVSRYGISEDHIFSSESKTFKRGIHRQTHGKGVDVILNATSGDFLSDTWDCIANFGTFVEIGKSGKSQLSMQPFDRNVTFASVDLSLLAEHRPAQVGELLDNAISLFEAGHVKPIHPIVEMPLSELTGAFRTVQMRKHSGKLVLTSDENVMVNMNPPKPPIFSLEEDATYVISEGTTELVESLTAFMIARGARHIITLSSKNRSLDSAAEETRDAQIVHVSIPADKEDALQKVSHCASQLPPVKGVVYAGASFKDASSEEENHSVYLGDFNEHAAMTKLLIELFHKEHLSFFAMLTSTGAFIGDQGLNGNSLLSGFQIKLADQLANSKTHFVSLSLGPIGGLDIDGGSSEPQQHSSIQGHVAIQKDTFFKLLEYSMSKQAFQDKCHNIVMGFGRASLLAEGLTIDLESPLLSHLPHSQEIETDENQGSSAKSIDQAIVAAESLQDAHFLICEAIRRKISALVALNYDETDLDTPLGDFGLDSLVAIEFKNWIGRALHAAMQTSEILDTPDIRTLTTLILSRTTLLSDKEPDRPKDGKAGETNKPQRKADDRSSLPETSQVIDTALPKLPLPDLGSTLKLWLESIRNFCSHDELAEINDQINEFQSSGGIGKQLQDRLIDISKTSSKESWLSEIYDTEVWFKKRQPLVPFSSFFFSHPLSSVQHGQAERAAIIASSSFKFKQMYDANDIKRPYLNDQPLCMETYKWLFNASRKPCKTIDQMQHFPENDYIVVLRHGHAFKVHLTDGQVVVPYERLKVTFEAILERTPREVSWVGILTSDERDSWAEIRDIAIEHNKQNEQYIHTMEAACFIICLDDYSPEDALQRANRFHFGDGANRWNDKTIQFVVCTNAVSAIIGDHTSMDASTANALNDFVMEAISKHEPVPKHLEANGVSEVELEECHFTTTPVIEGHISRIREEFTANISLYEHAFVTNNKLGAAFMRAQKCAPKSAFQMAIQLALRDYFGYNPPCWETVSLGTFRHGRVDIVQDILPPVAKFLAVADDETVQVAERRRLLLEASRAHANAVTRSFRGQSYARHMLALRHILREDEPLPSLFKNPIFEKMKPRKCLSNCHETKTLEKCCILADTEGIWLHYEVEDDHVRYSISSGVGNTSKFCKLLEAATERVVHLLKSA